MKTIKLELSVKLLLGAIALGLFLNAFKDFPPKANADHNYVDMQERILMDSPLPVIICDHTDHFKCAGVSAGRIKIQE